MSNPRQINRIADYFYASPWALLPEKLDAIDYLIECRQRGEIFTKEQVREFVAIDEDSHEVVTIEGVRVIPVFGVIEKRMNLFSAISGGTSTDLLAKEIRRAVDDPVVKAIVLDVDSPGGSAFGPAEVAAVIREARGSKRIVAVADELMASAAYWIGSAADEVVTTSTAAVGSIGVLSVHRDITKRNEASGVKVTIFRSTALKAAGNEHEPLNEAAARELQERVNTFHRQFVEAVAANRGISIDAAAALANGKLHIGQDAVNVGLADRIGTLNGVVEELAAKTRQRGSVRVEEEMPETTDVKPDTVPPAKPELTEAERAALRAAEKTRQQEIRVIAKVFFGEQPEKMAAVADHCIDNDLSVDQSRIYISKELEKDKNSMPVGALPSGTNLSESEKFYDCMSDAISLRVFRCEEGAVNFRRDMQGRIRYMDNAERVWSGGRFNGYRWTGKARKLTPGAEDYRNMSLLQMASEFIRVCTGGRVNPLTQGWDGMRIATVALGWEHQGMPTAGTLGGGQFHTTGSFPNLLMDAANKTLLAAYMERAGSWRRWVKIGDSVSDFKNINRISLGSAGVLEDIPEGKDFPEDELTDQRESYAVQTRGVAYSFTREMLINDDLNAFNTLTIRKARAAERTINKKCYQLLISNPIMRDGNRLFDDTNHKNHVDSGAAPSVGELNKMQQRLRKMTDPTRTDENVYLDHELAWVIVPPELEGTMLQLLTSEANPSVGGSAAGSAGVNNIWRGRLDPIVEPELNSDATLGTTAWYAGGDWRDADHLEVTFLRGEETPVMEEQYNFKNKGREFTTHQTFGLKFIDWTNIVKNDGA